MNLTNLVPRVRKMVPDDEHSNAYVKLDYVKGRMASETINGNDIVYYVQKVPGGYALNFNGYIYKVIDGKLQNAFDFCKEFFQEIKDGANSPIMDKHYKYKQFIKDYDISMEFLNYLRENDNQANLQSYSIKRAFIGRAYK